MSEIESLNRAKRTSVRSLRAMTVEDPTQYSRFQAQSTLEILDEDYKRYTETQESIIQLLDGDDAEKETDELLDIQRSYRLYRGRLQTIVHDAMEAASRQHTPPGTPASNTVSGFMNMNRHMHVKLPDIALPKFDGDLSKWLEFKDLFTALVHNNETLKDSHKMFYLRSSLEGDAKTEISSSKYSDESYQSAWEAVNKAFGSKRLLVYTHLKTLAEQPMVNNESEAKTLLIQVNQALRALESLGYPDEKKSLLLPYQLIMKLPKRMRREWNLSLKDANHIATFEELQTFLEKHTHNIDDYTASKTSKTPQNDSQKDRNCQDKCPRCKKPHNIFYCPSYSSAAVEEKYEILKSIRACTNCLKVGHKNIDCTSPDRCKKCLKKHNTSLHREYPTATSKTPNYTPNHKPKEHGKPNYKSSTTAAVLQDTTNTNEGSENPISESASISCASQVKNEVLLPTAIGKLRCPNGTLTKVRLVLDCCSQSEFVAERIVKKCGLSVQQSNLKITGIGGTQPPMSRAKTTLEITNNDGTFGITISAHIMAKIMPNLPSLNPNSFHEIKQRNIQLADPSIISADTVDILIGAKYFNHIIRDGFMDGFTNGITLRNTHFGWVIFGGGKVETTNEQICCFTLTQQLQKFWELEEPEQVKVNLTAEEEYCEKFFEQTTVKCNGRFQVRLPFKQNVNNSLHDLSQNDKPIQLGSTKNIAIKQLQSLEGRFNSNPILKQKYTEFIDEYLALGHMRPAGNIQNTYYMTHHGVFKKDSDKIRVVFNGSLKGDKGTSLNDELCVGPVVQRDIFDILLTFRSYEFPLVADIEKMYRQITIHDEDCQFQQIIWREDTLQSFELTTVTYGTASAPFTATRCIKQIALEAKTTHPETASKIENDFYVDDLVSGANSEEEALKLKEESTKLLKEAGFELRKWKSTLPGIKDNTSEPWSANDSKILGTLWNPKDDSFHFENALGAKKHLQKGKPTAGITKRVVLSEISKIYDPVGFLAPTTIIGKILMRDLWSLPLEWDTPLPQNEQEKYEAFKQMLQSIAVTAIPRNLRMANAKSIELHIFCDASEKAYAAVAYLRAFHKDKTFSTLICAKTRLAPIKPTSIPRLELCGAVLAAKLARRVLATLKIEIDCCIAWCDSTIVLSWLAKAASSWKQFVANRVSKIQNTIPSSQWRHISTTENPADIASRGKPPNELQNDQLWWNGPPWLSNPSQHPKSTWTYNKRSEDEKKKIKPLTASCITGSELDIIDKTSHFVFLINVTARCLRFINNMKETLKKNNAPNKISGSLTVCEFQQAVKFHVKMAQEQVYSKEIARLTKNKNTKRTSALYTLCPLLDKDSLLRVGGRLKNTNWPFEKSHPILLPSNHRFTTLLIQFYHKIHNHAPLETLHAIIRQKYWIIHGRNTVKKALRNCLSCIKQRARQTHQLMGDLPASRVQITRPFETVGIDYAGPIAIKPNIRTRAKTEIKSYICIFICLSTKAVHIELAENLSAQAFIAAFKRFASRRGTPSQVYSDNGTNFVASNHILVKQLGKLLQSENYKNEIQSYLLPREIRWSFIPPASPHFGGLWEANVKVIKRSLRTVIGEQKLTFEELYTILVQVEANMNSRPISAASDDPDDTSCLTPAHFLIGAPLTAIPDAQRECENISPKNRWQLVQHIQHQISKRWKNEYIAQLQKRNKWATPVENIKVGDLVLVQNGTNFSTQWSLGRILKTFPGSDGHTRVVELKTKDGIYQRPVTKIAKLPY